MGTDAFGRSTGQTSTRPSDRPASGGSRPDGPIGIPGWAVMLLIALISLGGTAVFLVKAERRNRDDPVQQALRGEITNLGPGSLLRADRLPAAYAAAVAQLQDGEVVTGLTVSPVGLQITTRDAGAFQRIVRVDVALDATAQAAGRSELPGLRPDRVDLRGVQPAVQRVLDRVEEDTALIEGVSLSLNTADGVARAVEWQVRLDEVRPRDTGWYARLDGGAVRRGDEDVTITRPDLRPAATPAPIPTSTPTRPSPPRSTTTTSSSVTIVRNGKRVRLSGAKARRLQRCLAGAAGDRPAFTRCLEEATG